MAEWEDVGGGAEQVAEAKPAADGWEDVGAAKVQARQPAPPPEKSDLTTAKKSLGKFGLGEFNEQNLFMNLGRVIMKKMRGIPEVVGETDYAKSRRIEEGLEPRELSTGQLVKEGVKFMKDRPLTATAELAKGLLYDPELLLLSASKGPQVAARMAEMAGAGAKMRAAAAMGGAAFEGAAAMATTEAARQAANEAEMDPSKIGASAVMGGVAVPVIKGTVAAWKGLSRVSTPAEGPPVTTIDRFRETVEDGRIKNPTAKQEPVGEAPLPKETPLEQTAFRNKETGQIVESGPRHNESLKKDPNYEQGFKTPEGEFLTREQAAEVARKDMGDLLKKPIDSEKGLHSTDFGEGGVPKVREGEAVLPPPETPQGRWARVAEPDKQLLATLGFGTLGAVTGAYLVGDEKVIGAVVGGALMSRVPRLPTLIQGFTQTVSPNTALKNAIKVGAVLGAGAYVGGKSDDPVLGAMLAGSVLLAAKTLKPASRLVTDDIINLRNGNLAVHEAIRYNLKKEIQRTIPQAERRSAVSHALDSGDPRGLNSAERSVFDLITKFHEELGAEAVDAEVIKGFRKNYISYIVERDPAMTPAREAGILEQLFGVDYASGGASPNTKFGKQGKYESFSELNKALEGSGLRLKTTDIAEIMDIYGKSMRQAIENRNMVNGLKTAKSPTGAGYLELADKGGNIPPGYEKINHPQLQGYGVHPDLVDSLRAVMENTNPNVITRAMLGLSQAVKRIQVTASLFHAKSLMEVYINAMGRGAFSRKTGVNFEPINEALSHFHKLGLGDDLALGIQHGLMMKVPIDINQSIIGNIGRAVNGLVLRLTGRDVKAGTAITDKIDYVNSKFDHVTWDYMHAGVKGALFLKEFETLSIRNMEAHARDPQKVPLKSREQLAHEIATYSNDLTGGLDWFRIAADSKTQLGRSLGMFFAGPQGQRMAQIIAFAPDWAVSTLRAGFKSLEKAEGDRSIMGSLKGLLRPENTTDLYRKYALRSTLYWITLLNGMNMATAGRYITQNKDPTRLEFADGTSMQVGKHTFESVHAVMDPAKFAYNKLGFAPKMLSDFRAGREGWGEGAPKIESFPAHVAQSALPFVANAASQSGLSAWERAKRAGLSFGGLPKYGYTEEQKAARRDESAERREKKRRKAMEDGQ